jgi:hypothetical protein
MSDILNGTVREVRQRIADAHLSPGEAFALHEKESASGRGPGCIGRIGVLGVLEELYVGKELDAVASPPPAPSPEPTPPAPLAPPKAPWRKRYWNGIALYVCATCGRDTTDASEMYEHVKRKHPRALAPDNTNAREGGV